MSGPKTKVLYIGGYSRSGTTLVERVLGQLEGFFAIGESRHIWQRSFLENQLCGCGVPFLTCPFWSVVTRQVFGESYEREAREAGELLAQVETRRNIPRMLTGSSRGDYGARLASYGGIALKLYEAIGRQSGCKVIIDSSKSPFYGLILAANPGLDLYVLHLVRDSRAVAHSMQRRKHRPEIWKERAYMPVQSPVRSGLEWGYINLFFEAFRLRRPGRVMTFRYEDFVSDPGGWAARVTRFVGETAPSPVMQGNVIDLAANHTVSGNPMRFKTGPVEIRADMEWREKMDPSARLKVTALTLPGLARYGYLGTRSRQRG
jgi:hypothetical protein